MKIANRKRPNACLDAARRGVKNRRPRVQIGRPQALIIRRNKIGNNVATAPRVSQRANVRRTSMKRLNLLLALIFCTAAMFMKTDAWAAPHEHGDSHNFGREDSHHVWHDAEYWHARHPDWVYRYHPEWAIEREEWWRADHEYHPEWFAYPFWQEYPVWGWGEYDRYHTWRSWDMVARARSGVVLCPSSGMGRGAPGLDARGSRRAS